MRPAASQISRRLKCQTLVYVQKYLAERKFLSSRVHLIYQRPLRGRVIDCSRDDGIDDEGSAEDNTVTRLPTSTSRVAFYFFTFSFFLCLHSTLARMFRNPCWGSHGVRRNFIERDISSYPVLKRWISRTMFFLLIQDNGAIEMINDFFAKYHTP